MEKRLPDPPFNLASNKSFTEDLLKDRSALCRAVDSHLTGNPVAAPGNLHMYNISDEVTLEDAQLYIADLLRCASVTAHQCGDHLDGADRAMVFSVWHLLEIAKAMVDRSIDCLHIKPR
ncbi:hypothetical protein N8H74_09010 [Pseudomonas sp. B2M1-30]|uniref:DUF3077 domain-containing protein n=1 Tax=Pseudomonas koreensis TaxID=198620 RepID=A0A9X2XMH3_9PSED|nr:MULTISPECIES: hypothetical protein [Pseudomonas]MBV4476557.1 hypothetical protein [Pseudomonas botevensis]MCU0118391.1 hypothetical protein [Pseudomonas sp. B2M1-30]MCU7251172.1 hypothetical protein [Pseudomonas koreensis]MCU7259571.1 hypothetical protein [Pseudomonas koreensis]